MKNHKRTRFLEFLLIGVVMGVIEDILAIIVVTDSKITLDAIPIILIIAIPFAFLSEYVVDHPDFWTKLLRINKVKK
ncbi:MAG TPA: hypothetical protein VGA49_00875 [Patescibacteria group bacterium]